MNPAEFANIANTEETFWWYQGMEKILFGLLDRHTQGRSFQRVLEGGCGTGYLAKRLQERYLWPVFPLDLGADGLRYAARKYGLVRLVQGDVAQLPFDDGTFDLALSMDVIVHFPRGAEQAAFMELSRVLSSGGLCIVRVSALDILRSRHSVFAHERQRFTKSRLQESLEAAGLRVEHITYANSLLLPVALAKFRIWEPIMARPAASGVEPVSPWLNRLLAKPLEWESRWLAKGRRSPIGQSLIALASKR